MDIVTILLVAAVPVLILGLVIFIGIRDHRSKRRSFEEGDITSRSREQIEADAAARAAHVSRAAPF
jgi:hypothetical protein